VLGFQALHALAPEKVGACTARQSFDAGGNAVQPTTHGLMVWRRQTNWTAFTNGYRA